MRDRYQRHPATHMGLHSNQHATVHMAFKTHADTYNHTCKYTGQEKVTHLNTLTGTYIYIITCVRNTCSAHAHTSLFLHTPCKQKTHPYCHGSWLIWRFVFISLCYRRQLHGPAVLQKSSAWLNTPGSFMCNSSALYGPLHFTLTVTFSH